MKKSLIFIWVLLSAGISQAQLNPVSWTFTAKKTASKTYEIHMTATMQAGWHLYSQTQPEDAIAIPTTFTLNNNPLITKNGKIKEIGKMLVFHDARLDISAHQYANTVDFVQVVKLKANAKTNFSGNVEYQTCDDSKCLPPKTIVFNVALK
ncbi:MAG TPA: protein-disulfide reductase DsbD domain-containing protein [Chitinophagaceae bacterium]|nr:protein-disulfide reductase DsbD domain-containing protein [Chitinophagaceae bacterium]